MKRVLGVALWALLLVPLVATAAPLCLSSVGYDTYVALGAGGCQLRDKLFYNFTYSGSGSDVPGPIPAAITVTALDVPFFPGFQFQGPWYADHVWLHSLLAFDVVVLPGGLPISRIDASMDADYWRGSVVEVVVNITGAFTGDLNLYRARGRFDWSDSLGVYPSTRGRLHIANDIWVRAEYEDAHLFMLENRFFSEARLPEPASLLLLGTGLVGLRVWRKRR